MSGTRKESLDWVLEMKERRELEKIHGTQEVSVDWAINIILDESDPQSPVFVEIENDKGQSIRIGTRIPSNDGLTRLRITVPEIIEIT